MDIDTISAIAQIIGAVGTLVVSTVALLVARAALRTQRDALPVSAAFGFGTRMYRDDDGVRWIWAWMRNTGTRCYVHDVSPHEWKPADLPDELTPNLSRVGLPESLPPDLRGARRRAVRRAVGVFAPGYLRTESYSMFWVSCPPGVEKVKFTAAVSVGRRDSVRFVSSRWTRVPV